MRHLVRGKKLGRDVPHRKATLRTLSVALIKEHRIVTTLSKAKELRKYVEPLITRAKEDSSHNRRQVFGKLQDKKAVSHLFEEVAQKAMDRPGGYTRVIKAGFRKGDGAEQAVIELVDYNDIKPEDTSGKKRTRRAGKSNKPISSGSESRETKEQPQAKKESAGEAKESADSAEEAKDSVEEKTKTTEEDKVSAEAKTETAEEKTDETEEEAEDKKTAAANSENSDKKAGTDADEEE